LKDIGIFDGGSKVVFGGAMQKKIYIYGAGGHAKVVASAARLCGYIVAGFWEDSKGNVGKSFFGAEIVDFDSIPAGSDVFIAFGDNHVRYQRGLDLVKRFNMPAIIHPAAQVADSAKIGRGTYIGSMANIDPDVIVGDFCIINNSANISHECSVGSGTHIASGCMLAGNVKVGITAFCGMGVSIAPRLVIGDNCVVGTGSVVLKDLPPNVTAVGVPSKIIREN